MRQRKDRLVNLIQYYKYLKQMNASREYVNPLRGDRNSYEDDEQKCIICAEKIKVVNKFFAECDHQGTCVKCAQSAMIQQIQAGIFPKCFIKQGCNAKITTNEHSLFNYFTADNGKKRFYQFELLKPVTELTRLSIRYCKKPNCKGIINFDRCTKCCTYYCQLCGELDHKYGSKCSQSTQFSIENLKQCPKCSQNYVRDEGCIHVICPTCKFSFCQVCHDQWNTFHHACNMKKIDNTANKRRGKQKNYQCCQIF